MNIAGMPLPYGLLALMGLLSLFWTGVEPEDPKLMAWALDFGTETELQDSLHSFGIAWRWGASV